jgi:HPt (histidine-containing phosphotransfer) domain-containing protein
MDTGKIIKVIDDIQLDENQFAVQTTLTNLLSYYQQNVLASVNESKHEVWEASVKSRISRYTATDFKVLEKLEGETLFGPGTYERLNDILAKQPHEVPGLLQEFITERSSKITSLNQLRTSLEDLGFESRALTGDDYEIGFSLPDSYTDVNKTEDTLKDMREFLNALSNGIGEQQPLKIKYVSNGSLELFLEVSKELANNFGIVLDYALKIYALIKAFEDIKKSLKVISKDRRGPTEKTLKEELKDQTDELIDELIKELPLSTPDDANSVKMLFKRFLKHIESGVNAEVRTPELSEPEEPAADATDAEVKQYNIQKKLYDAKYKIDERNQNIFILQQNNFYGLDTKYLVDPDESKKSESE